jgi:hypothetical protein
MACGWHVHGMCTAHTRHVHGMCTALAWHMHGICTALAQHVDGTSAAWGMGAVLVFVGSNFLTEPDRKRLRQIGRNQMGFGA